MFYRFLSSLRANAPLAGLVGLVALATLVTATTVEVPRTTNRVVADGQVGESEWAGALTFPSEGQPLSRWQHDGALLAIATSVPNSLTFATVCLLRGDTVSVLHASAAVGSAAYARAGPSTWTRVRPFTFRRIDTPVARDSVLASDGWVASLQPGTSIWREHLLRMATNDTLRLAIGRPTPFGAGPASALGPDDDCQSPRFALGDAPATATFRVAEWVDVRLR